MRMSALKITLILCIIVHTVTQANGKDKYTDENRPYEFGFSIDGEQHRHEKKDENGIIMGEFGFITADGVYHVTVYATDEQGRFKILSMKNIRVKPYPSAATQNSRTGHSLALPSPAKSSSSPSISPTPSVLHDKQSELAHIQANNNDNTKALHSQLPPRQPASPVKSCSHCSLPTTTTIAPPQVSNLQPNRGNEKLPNSYDKNQNAYNNNRNYPDNQSYYNQGSPTAPAAGSIPSFIGFNNDQSVSQPGISSPSEFENYDRGNTYQSNQANVHSNPSNVYNNESNQQSYGPEIFANNEPHMENTNTNVSPNYNTEVNPITYTKNSQQSINNAFVSNPNLNSEYPGSVQSDSDKNSGLQQSFSDESQGNVNGGSVDSDNLSNAQGNRSPKKYEPSSETVRPYNNYVDTASKNTFGSPELSNTAPIKPTLISAQMQIVDKNTDIYHKNPGERDGLPEGVTKDYMERVLYVFNYTVGFHGHYEKGFENGAKQGYYYVTGRNGVRTRVDYEADEKGFRPKISQEVLDVLSDEVPKPETEKEQKYGLKSYEFKWLYFPVESKQHQK